MSKSRRKAGRGASTIGMERSEVTIVRWCELAMESVAAGLRRGAARSGYDLDLERQLDKVREAFTDLAMRHDVVQKALKACPSRNGE